MGNSYDNLIIHLVFATKERRPLLTSVLRPKLFAYMMGILKNHSCEPVLVGGYTDHVHSLCRLSRNMSVADLCREVKSSSSRWIRSHGEEFRDFAWQKGYGVFSVSESNIESVKKYILHQEEHHRFVSFDEEFRKLLIRHGIQFDERYIF